MHNLSLGEITDLCRCNEIIYNKMEIAHETSHLYRLVCDYANTIYSIYVENTLYLSRYI